MTIPGCEKDTPPVTPPQPGEAQPVEPPAEGAPEMSGTIQLLQWTPDQAQIACVMPSFTRLETQILALDERLPSAALKDTYQKALLQIGLEHGLGAITSIEDLAQSQGLDSTKPMALYINVAKFMEESGEEIARLQANPGSSPDDLINDLEDLENHEFVIAFSATDLDVAQQSIEKFFKEQNPDHAESTLVECAGETIVAYDTLAYCFARETLFMGNLELLKATLARIADPLPLRYGTPAFPQTSPDEAVMLIFGGRLYPSYEKLFTQMAQDPAMQAMLPVQLEQLKVMLPKEGTDEPSVTTFIWDEEKIEVRSRMELEYFPHALALSGKPGMLRLTPMLSENTLAFASVRITEPMKAAILQQIKLAKQATVQDSAEMQQIEMFAQQAADILGDEFTMGFAAGGEGMPNACAMLALKNPDVVKTMVQVMAATFLESTETYKEIEISTVKAPIPVQIAVAFPNDIALVSTNLTDMKAIIDRYLAEQPSGLLASLDPPLDSTLEHYGVFSIDGKLISDIVLPLAALSGQANPEQMAVAQECAALIDTLRMASGVNDTWLESEMTLHFKPAQ